MNHDISRRYATRYLNVAPGRLSPEETRFNAARDAEVSEAWRARAEKASALHAAARGPGA